ncbi:MAG: sensor histidine kinase [Desulfosoma sp.]|uniref:sensor histidine kinase n=1 Tax=Desulfosoma sp. TaxID=2603217 RepID=UPI004049B39A
MDREALEHMAARVREKKAAYERYNFERLQEEAFATFFDLAQEYTSLENLYLICVTVPKEFFGLESRLYVLDHKTGRPEQVCTSTDGVVRAHDASQTLPVLSEKITETAHSYILPIRGNVALTQWLPFASQSPILGLFEIYPKELVDEKSLFFLEKFSNRIGYNLHQKLLLQQNIQHIKFINQLVADIEHNVISPNLYYKLFLIRLKKSIDDYKKIQEELSDLIMFTQTQDSNLCRELCELYHHLATRNDAMEEDYQSLKKHYEHTSLFLETLLRRDHFEKGTYVLRRQSCNFRTEIIQPILERYKPVLAKAGIQVDNRLEDIPDEEVTLFVDKGLISQVFDNLFSNAVKYTREVEDARGQKIKFISYHRKILKNYFGEGVHGVQFNIFTTGQPLSTEEAQRLFDEGFRAANVGREKGTGHGLHFVKNVVEIHGGEVGCEPKKYGNIIYFILPIKEPQHVSAPESR